MNYSPENQKVISNLISDMLQDGFEHLGENTFYKKIGQITISFKDNAIALMQGGVLYGLIPEKEFSNLTTGFEPMLTKIKYLLAFSMRQDMDRVLRLIGGFFMN